MKVIKWFLFRSNWGLLSQYMFVEDGKVNIVNLIWHVEFIQGNLLLTMKRAEAAVPAFRGAQELRPDIRSYQGLFCAMKNI